MTFDDQDLVAAIRDVAANRCKRVCAPGRWRVWCDGGAVKFEMLR